MGRGCVASLQGLGSGGGGKGTSAKCAAARGDGGGPGQWGRSGSRGTISEAHLQSPVTPHHRDCVPGTVGPQGAAGPSLPLGSLFLQGHECEQSVVGAGEGGKMLPTSPGDKPILAKASKGDSAAQICEVPQDSGPARTICWLLEPCSVIKGTWLGGTPPCSACFNLHWLAKPDANA